MVKLLLFVLLLSIVFSGCVGTLVKNDRGVNVNNRVTKGIENRSKTTDKKDKVIKKVNPIQ
jgi:hypothetical protein